MAYSELPGVICLALTALLSLLSVSFYFMKPSLRLHNYGNTHINGYFKSLLLANAIQSFGTVMNFKWAADREVTSGVFCSAQGGIKQAGNVATALWSLVLALHLFNLLFLRLKSTKADCLHVTLNPQYPSPVCRSSQEPTFLSGRSSLRLIFNLTGFANVLLLGATRKLLPDAGELPEFSTARQDMRKSLFQAGGIRPFTLERSDTAEKFNPSVLWPRPRRARAARASSPPHQASRPPYPRSE
ncbi:hypothetical protein B0H13DRAFT_2365236 [Mycena leptocephala]|nr:hypothetical protein B0H13DRAFT_2365236 [Mycena leptocephala]